MNRKQIENKIEANIKKIKALKAENDELRIKSYQISDKQQWYTEEQRVSGKGKKKKKQIVGLIHFNHDFKDDDTGEVVTIERSQIVRIDGVWQLWN